MTNMPSGFAELARRGWIVSDRDPMAPDACQATMVIGVFRLIIRNEDGIQWQVGERGPDGWRELASDEAPSAESAATAALCCAWRSSLQRAQALAETVDRLTRKRASRQPDGGAR